LKKFSFRLDPEGFARIPVILRSGDTLIVLRGLIDTGADTIYLDRHISEFLKLQPLRVEEVGVAGGILNASVIVIDSVAVASQNFQKRLIMSAVNALAVDNLGEEIVIGIKFFEKCILSFNFVRKVLVIEGNWEKD